MSKKDSNKFINSYTKEVRDLANEAKSMVEDAFKISDYDGYNVFNLISSQNFYGDQSKKNVEDFRKIIEITSFSELIMDIGMIDERLIPSKLPKVASDCTLFINSALVAINLGNNDKRIIQITNEIMTLNKCGLEEFKSFINNLPKKKGWEEWKRKDGNKNGNF